MVLAQDFDYHKAYGDYVYNYDLYKKAHSDFELKRAQYLQTGTLASKTEAQKATAAMLQSRDQTTITYLTAIRLKMAETQGIDEGQRDTYYTFIDEDVSWYRSHRDGVSSAASLEDLSKDSEEAYARYQATLLTIIKSLSLVSNGKIDNFQSQSTSLTSNLEAKINEIRANGDKKTDNLARWVLEVRNRIDRSQDKEIEAWTILNKLKSSEKEKLNAYSDAQARFAESLQYLKEAVSYLKQITTEIKTAD